MICTASQVKTRVLHLLDDPLQQSFTDAIVLEGYGEAIDSLYSAFLLYQIPRIKVVTTYTLPANTASVTPETVGIADFGELIHLEERRSGSTDKWTTVWECSDLPQRDPNERLAEFEWRGDAFYFVGSNEARDLRFAYFATTEQPTDFSGSTGVDGAKTFLAKYTAAMIAPRKGYDELGDKYKIEAVGPKYDQGIIGGELFRLILPMVRGMQRVQVAPRPFSSTTRMRVRRAMPYVAVQPGTTGGSGGSTGGGAVAPTQFSTTDGSITGAINGVNDTFTLAQSVSAIEVFRDGVRMTIGYDVIWSGPSATFRFAFPSLIPTAGTVITANGWIA